jgi:hypothetical protein
MPALQDYEAEKDELPSKARYEDDTDKRHYQRNFVQG